jgi:protein SCO1/2
MRRSLTLAACLFLYAGPALAQDDVLPVLRDVGFDQRLGESVPLDLTFRNERGESVQLGDYFGEKPVVLTLIYYECPMLCTLTLNGLVSALDLLAYDVGEQFEVVTVSFEPKETPEMAAAKKEVYLRKYDRPGAEQGWHFLTGDAESVAALTAAVGFRYAWDDFTQQYAHPSGILVLTPDGRLARYLYGIEYAPKDLRFALIEASEGRIGSPVDQVILYCYQYDPQTGKYGAAIMRILRAGALVTVLALGGLLAVMWRRDNASDRQPPEAND